MPQSAGTFLAVNASDIGSPTHRRQGDTFHLLRSANHRVVKSFSKVDLKSAATHWRSLFGFGSRPRDSDLLRPNGWNSVA